MRILVSIIALVLCCTSLEGQTVRYEGQLYEMVDWDEFAGGVAFGTVQNFAISFDASNFETATIFTFDGYSTDDGFDNLEFLGGDQIETVRFVGGIGGVSTFASSLPLTELLMVIGGPGDDDAPSQYGPSLWLFDSFLSIQIVDAEEVKEGTFVVSNNLLDNTAANVGSSPIPFHMSCVLKLSDLKGFDQFEFTQLASPGPDLVNATFGIPVEKALGDINMDGNIDLLDVAPFVEVLTGGEFVCEADINQDGFVDLLDVAPFVNILIG